jgi:hypothetical protein
MSLDGRQDVNNPIVAERLRSASAKGGDQILASLLTTSAGLCADPAVLVHLGVPFALVTAGSAGGHAGLERGAGEVGVVAGVPRQHPTRGVTDVGAVQAGTDALDQVGDPGLAQARIGARSTGLGAVEAFVDTPGQCCAVDVAEVGGVGAQHLRYMGHRYLPSSGLDVIGRYPFQTESQPSLTYDPQDRTLHADGHDALSATIGKNH